MDMGTELKTLESKSSDLLKGLHSFEVKKSLRKTRVNKPRSDHLSIGEYQQLVVHLHKTIEKTEQQRLVLEQENLQLAKRCRVQRKLVTYLRGVATDKSNQLADCQSQLEITRSRPISQMRTQRVVSLNGALQRISGADSIEETTEFDASLAAIDPEDLQSIDEAQSGAAWLRLPQSLVEATVAFGRSGLSTAGTAVREFAGRIKAIYYKPSGDGTA